MASPETHTNTNNKIEPKSWDELENPVNYIGTPYLDESTVPDDKQGLYDTVIAAHYSAIDQEREDAAAAELAAAKQDRQKFLAERREQALARLDTIAVQSAIETNYDNQTAEGPVYHVAPDGTLITESEAKDMREARELRSQF